MFTSTIRCHAEFHNKSTSLYVECRTEFLDNPSIDFDCVFNCMTHFVLDDDEDLLNIDQIGEYLKMNFKHTRMTGVWGSRIAVGSTQ